MLKKNRSPLWIKKWRAKGRAATGSELLLGCVGETLHVGQGFVGFALRQHQAHGGQLLRAQIKSGNGSATGLAFGFDEPEPQPNECRASRKEDDEQTEGGTAGKWHCGVCAGQINVCHASKQAGSCEGKAEAKQIVVLHGALPVILFNFV